MGRPQKSANIRKSPRIASSRDSVINQVSDSASQSSNLGTPVIATPEKASGRPPPMKRRRISQSTDSSLTQSKALSGSITTNTGVQFNEFSGNSDIRPQIQITIPNSSDGPQIVKKIVKPKPKSPSTSSTQSRLSSNSDLVNNIGSKVNIDQNANNLNSNLPASDSVQNSEISDSIHPASPASASQLQDKQSYPDASSAQANVAFLLNGTTFLGVYSFSALCLEGIRT